MSHIIKRRFQKTSQGNRTNSILPDPDGGGQSNGGAGINASDYATKARLLMDLCRDLRDLGAESLIYLPRIVVIGSQSAGKSSLVEAVSGINVPRDAGTCTRCPMEISMSRSTGSWSCTIFLEDVGDNKTFSQFGPTLMNKNAIDIWLRRAQAAILSPHLNQHDFRTKTIDELRDAYNVDSQMLKFSQRRVRIKIEDVDAANLDFVDLPGLIQNESQELIDLVKELVEENISQPNTVIVIAIPMSDDMENQPAVKIAREADPDGSRTLGVLTKPDTIPPGSTNSRNRWKDVLQGKLYQTKHGYFCVRLPDDEERARNITRRESERMASQYFADTSPWSEFANKSRFGVPNFVSFISKLLIEMIETSLPGLKKDVDRLLSDCIEELKEMPLPVTEHHTAEILKRITDFCEDLKGAVYGTNFKKLANLNRSRYKQFKADIYATAPDFRPAETLGQYPGPVISEFEPEPDNDVLMPKAQVQALSLRDVRTIIAESIGWELPGYVPFEAMKTLILKSIELWPAPTESCFNDIYGYLTDSVHKFIKSNFSQFSQLENHLTSLIQSELDDCKQKAFPSVHKTLLMEDFPYTQNLHYLASMKTHWLGVYTAALLPKETYPVVLHLKERYEQELRVMADVRAYFQVTYKRVIDNIPLAIEQELNQTFADGIQTTLFQKFVSGPEALSEERMREFLAEDPDIASKRKFLVTTRERLVEIKRRLDRFGE